MLLEPGYRLIERYEIKHALGSGSFGTVYMAFDHRLSQNIAIKELKSEWLIDHVIRRRFINDAWAMRNLESPNVVTVYDLLDPEKDNVESYYIIMQYLKGGSLEGLLKRNRTLPIKDSLEIIIGVCHALELAHKAEIYHRDIKPDNILLGVSGEAKLSDFGVAHIPGSGSSGEMVGTLIWLSPEQAKRQKHIDGKADIFSLAAVLYRMLTGMYYLDFETRIAKARKAIDHKNEQEENLYIREQVCDLIKSNRPRKPSVYRVEIPPELDVIILKNLATNPDDRFSAAELANALSSILKSVADNRIADELSSAQALLDEGSLNEAAKTIQKILRKYNDNASAHELMGDVHYRRGEYSSAVLQWETSVKLPSASPAIYAKLGKLYSRVGNFSDAALTFRKGVEVSPKDHNLFYGLAGAEWENGNHQAAIDALNNSCRLRPDKRKEALLSRWQKQMNDLQNDMEDNTLHD